MSINTVRTLFVLSCLATLSVESSPAANLSGVVFDRSGAVIPSASLDLFSGEHEWNAKTDALGHFRFPDLAPGVYDLEVTASAFRKQMIQGLRIGSSDPEPISVTLEVADTGDNCRSGVADISYEPAPGNPGIKGVVKFYSRKGASRSAPVVVTRPGTLAGALITVSRDASSRPLARARTDKKGEFEIPDLGAGLYVLKASRRGFINVAIYDIRVRRAKVLRVQLEMLDFISICQ